MRKIIKTGIIATIFFLAFGVNTDWISSYVSQPATDNAGIETVAVSANPFIQNAYAQETEGKKEAFNAQQIIDDVAKWSVYIHRFFYPMINFFAFQTGNFLGNDYIYAGAMGTMLNKIWVVSRNIVNISFVLILLFLALKEIFFIKEEGAGELKKNLVKIALLLVAVNFSWLGTKVVLDAANVVTNVVFSLPTGVASTGVDQIVNETPCNATSEDTMDFKTVNKTIGPCMPTAIYAPVASEGTNNYRYLNEKQCTDDKIAEKYQSKDASGKEVGAFTSSGDINPTPDTANKEYQDMTTYCWGNIDFFKYNKNTSTIYLVYGMARIQNIINASSDESITQLSVGIIFSLFIQVAYTLSLLALFIALIFRMAVLWLFVAFSPLLVLMMYFGQGKGGEAGKLLSVDEFIRWAFVPAMVGAVFSVAFIMLGAGQAMMWKDSSPFDHLGTGGVEMGAKLFKFKSLFMGMDTIQEFIWLLMVLVILWMGVFGILKSYKGISMITDKIKGYGTSAATFVAKLPYYAPITPMVNPKTGNFEFGKMSEMMKPVGDLLKAAKKFEGDQGGTEWAAAQEKATKFNDSDRLQAKNYIEKGGNGDKLASMYNFGSAEDMMRQGVTAVDELLTASKFTDSTERNKIITYLQKEVENSGKIAKAKDAAVPAAPAAGTVPAAPPPAAPAAGTGGPKTAGG